MRVFSADLHIHTVLSPCGDLDMSPLRIISEAAGKGLDIIAVTDHNHTGHARLTREIGARKGVWVVYGAEVNTREEVHCLTFFDTDHQLELFQEQLDRFQPLMPNDSGLFGAQLIVDEQERILREVGPSLYPGLELGISELSDLVHELEGLFVPAHVDRPMNGLYAQLGFFPDQLDADAVEIHRKADPGEMRTRHPELNRFQLMKNSDAHYPADIGRSYNFLTMDQCSFAEFAMALRGKNGRKVQPV